MLSWLEQEMLALEKSYQEQRRKLLAEVRADREQLQKENCRILAEKESTLKQELEKLCQETHEKQQQQEKSYQVDMEVLRSELEAEKNAWMLRQKVEWADKEKAFKEECKRNRDRDIDMALKKLETEATEREHMVINKFRKEKERYIGEMRDLENVQKELQSKLKETRDQCNCLEEKNAKLLCQLNKLQMEYDSFKQTKENEVIEKEKMIDSLQNVNKCQLTYLKQEATRARLEYEGRINEIHAEKENELQRVFARVKEVVVKKDETIMLVEKQRDAALEHCCQLEQILNQSSPK